jgi:hypothetical protein
VRSWLAGPIATAEQAHLYLLGVQVLITGTPKQATGNRQQATGNKQQATGNTCTVHANSNFNCQLHEVFLAVFPLSAVFLF